MAHSADAEYQHFSPGGIIATSGECLWGGGESHNGVLEKKLHF